MTREVLPALPAHEAAGTFPRALIEKTGQAGWFGVLFPEALGGSDVGFLAMAVIAEEMARLDPGFALCHNPQGGTCPYTIYAGGTDEQCERFIPALLAGQTIGMWALTEAGGGSDAAGNLKTFAQRRGDRYVLNGRKMFATLSDQTDAGVLFARTDRQAGHRGISAFVVEPKKHPGFTAQPIEFTGLSKITRSCEVVLEDFEVPAENRLGAEGDGFRIAMHAVQAGRVSVAARAVGIARACLEEAMRYAQQRPVRGQPLANYQMTQAAIADALVAVEGARLMTYHAASLMDRDRPANRVAAQAKLAASYALKQAAGSAQELFGGYGLASEYRIARLASYAHVFLVGEGAPAVQRILIAEDALGIKAADRHATRYRRPRG
jgi:alkylation response protein AidB-like acyl-CoA dehydrogenase